MAKNRLYRQTERTLPLVSVTPAAAVAGDPVLCGQIPGVCLKDADAANQAIMQTDGIFNLSVQGKALSTTSTHGTSIRPGDILYFDANDASVKLNKRSGGVRFGYALGTIAGAGSVVSVIPVQIGY